MSIFLNSDNRELWEFYQIAVSFPNAGVEELMLLCKSCVELKESQAGSAEIKEPLSHSSEMEPQPPSVELEESPAPSGELTDTSNRYEFFFFFPFHAIILTAFALICRT